MSAVVRPGGFTNGHEHGLLTHLNDRDVCWLNLLACGVRISDLHPRSVQYAKTRMRLIRKFLDVKTTAAAVVEAFAREIVK